MSRGRVKDSLRSIVLGVSVLLKNACSLEKPNQALQTHIPVSNKKFAVPAKQPGSAFREPHANWDEHFCFKYACVVGQDNVVRVGPHRLQILPGNDKSTFAHTRIEVHHAFDNALAIYWQRQKLETTAAVSEPVLLRKSALELAEPPVDRNQEYTPSLLQIIPGEASLESMWIGGDKIS